VAVKIDPSLAGF